jgi:hypothetical protein
MLVEVWFRQLIFIHTLVAAFGDFSSFAANVIFSIGQAPNFKVHIWINEKMRVDGP